MAEIRFKAKKNEVRLNVIVDRDGVEESKELSFDCSPNNYAFIKQSTAAYAEMKKALAGAMTVEKADALINAERDAFEAAAPGKWNEFIEFIGGDVEHMAELIALMFETIRAKGVASKLDDVSPVVPDGEAI